MTNWTQLLEGPSADRAVETARDIARALLAPDAPVDARASGASLSGGTSGLALFFTTLGEVTGDQQATETAMELLNRAVEDVSAESALDPGLYGRTLGVGWAMSRLAGRLYEADDDESDLDDLVDKFLEFDPWPGHYDLITGLVGLGVYWLARLPHPRAVPGLERTVARLEQLSQRDEHGVTWFTTPQMFAARAHQFPEGHYDIGLAHGISGVVALLAEATAAGVESARPLLADAARWVASHRLESHPLTRYPGMFATPDEPAGIRTAWCYGDPGVAVGLLAAAHALGDDELLAEASATTRACVGRLDIAATRVADAGLCHGSAGLGHIFNRLGQGLGDEQVLDLARQWFDATFDIRDPAHGIAGFPAFNPLDGAYHPQAGLLEGASGVGLALLSAASDVPPWWDGLYLVADRTLARP